METDSEMTYMMKLTVQDLEAVIMNMFKELKKKYGLNEQQMAISTEKRTFCKEIPDWKYNVWGEEFTGGFNSRLEKAEVRAHKLEDGDIKWSCLKERENKD